MIRIFKNNMMSWLTILASLAAAVSFINELPEQIPVHFDSLGRADRHASKLFALLFLPCIASFSIIGTSAWLRLSPEGYQAEQSKRTVSQFNFGITVFIMLVYLASLRESVEPGAWMSWAVPVGLSSLTFFIGNYLGKIERNFVIGFRLRWTLASDENWRRTHRFAGRAFVASGLVSLVWVILRPNIVVSLAGIILPSISTVLFSYRDFRSVQAKERSS